MFIPAENYSKILQWIPIACVDVLIMHEGKCLLLKRDNEPAKDTYWFPGGRIYKNELIEDAAIRKAREETNINCRFEKIVSVEESLFEQKEGMVSDVHTINVCCLVQPEDISSLKLDSLHKGAKWIDSIAPSLHPAVANPLRLIGFINTTA